MYIESDISIHNTLLTHAQHVYNGLGIYTMWWYEYSSSIQDNSFVQMLQILTNPDHLCIVFEAHMQTLNGIQDHYEQHAVSLLEFEYVAYGRFSNLLVYTFLPV